MAKCPKGKILRKAYTRKDGTRVKSTCVPDKGKPGKTAPKNKVLPVPVKGALGKYGYHDIKNMTAAARHAALTKGVQDAGYATIIRRVNLIANYNKNSDPKTHKMMKSDIKWIQKNLCEESKSGCKGSRKASRKGSRKTSRKASRKGSRKTSRKGSRKTSRKSSRKGSRKASRKVGSKKQIKAGTMTVGGRSRQLYRIAGSKKKFYRYRGKDGSMKRRYV